MVPSSSSLDLLVIVLRTKEEVPQRANVAQKLENDIAVVVGLDVVEARKARVVGQSVVGTHHAGTSVHLGDGFGLKERVEEVSDILQRSVNNFVVVGQTVEAMRLKVQKHVMVFINAVGVGVRRWAAALKSKLVNK